MLLIILDCIHAFASSVVLAVNRVCWQVDVSVARSGVSSTFLHNALVCLPAGHRTA